MARAAETTGKSAAFGNALKFGIAVGTAHALRSNTVRSTVSKTLGKLKSAVSGGVGSARSKRTRAQMSVDEVGKCVADCLNSAEGRAVTDQFNAVTDRVLHS